MDNLTRRSFGTSLAVAGAGALSAAGPKRPNIVFICADQHDGRIMGCSGHPIAKTPNMDRLASMGVLFRNAYCGSPVCCPSRASMMTGMFPSDVGSYCNSTAFEGSSPTWATRLRAAGYDCWATGKLDLAPGRDLGFREFETQHGNFEEPDITSLFRRPCCYRTGQANGIDGGPRKREHRDNRLVRNAIAHLAEETPKRDTPWVTYLGIEQPKSWGTGGLPEYLKLYPVDRMPLPEIPPGYFESMHPALQVLRSFQLFSVPLPDARIRRARAGYYARITEVDAHVGRLMEQLESTGQWENTVFVYTADHGEMLGEHGLWHKNSLLDASARVPLIIAGPGLPRDRVVDTPVSHVDLAATLLELGGAPAGGLRGQSLLPLALGTAGGHPGYAISECHSHGNPTGSYLIRKGDWKYIYFSWYEPLLFHMKDDPGELHNRAADPAAAPVLRELHGILTSVLDPSAVTLRAFEEQDRRLAALVRTSTATSFRKVLESRLGRGQAAVLTSKYYQGNTG